MPPHEHIARRPLSECNQRSKSTATACRWFRSGSCPSLYRACDHVMYNNTAGEAVPPWRCQAHRRPPPSCGLAKRPHAAVKNEKHNESMQHVNDVFSRSGLRCPLAGVVPPAAAFAEAGLAAAGARAPALELGSSAGAAPRNLDAFRGIALPGHNGKRASWIHESWVDAWQQRQVSIMD